MNSEAFVVGVAKREMFEGLVYSCSDQQSKLSSEVLVVLLNSVSVTFSSTVL